MQQKMCIKLKKTKNNFIIENNIQDRFINKILTKLISDLEYQGKKKKNQIKNIFNSFVQVSFYLYFSSHTQFINISKSKNKRIYPFSKRAGHHLNQYLLKNEKSISKQLKPKGFGFYWQFKTETEMVWKSSYWDKDIQKQEEKSFSYGFIIFTNDRNLLKNKTAPADLEFLQSGENIPQALRADVPFVEGPLYEGGKVEGNTIGLSGGLDIDAASVYNQVIPMAIPIQNINRNGATKQF